VSISDHNLTPFLDGLVTLRYSTLQKLQRW
jgi:hypothetical protein